MQLLFFAGTLLSTAQSYPSLTASNPPGGASVGISTAAGAGPCLSQALTMSLTSTSSDSEQVSLEVSLTNLFSFFSLLILSYLVVLLLVVMKLFLLFFCCWF